jgi:hypothetical protein
MQASMLELMLVSLNGLNAIAPCLAILLHIDFLTH